MHFVDAKGILTGSGGYFGMNRLYYITSSVFLKYPQRLFMILSDDLLHLLKIIFLMQSCLYFQKFFLSIFPDIERLSLCCICSVI